MDATKYIYVESALGRSIVLKNTPGKEKYKTFKTHLLKAFELSGAERAGWLFFIQGLGDNKMPELMDRMLDVMGEHKPYFLFIQMFLQQLPSQVQAALANKGITDCQVLAEEADKIFIAGQKHGAAMTGHITTATPPPAKLTVAKAQFENIVWLGIIHPSTLPQSPAVGGAHLVTTVTLTRQRRLTGNRSHT